MDWCLKIFSVCVLSKGKSTNNDRWVKKWIMKAFENDWGLCVCACMHGLAVQVCFTYLCGCMWSSEVDVKLFSSISPPYSLREKFFCWIRSSVSARLTRLVNLGLHLSASQCWGHRSALPGPTFHMGIGSQLRCSCLHKHFSDWVVSSASTPPFFYHAGDWTLVFSRLEEYFAWRH